MERRRPGTYFPFEEEAHSGPVLVGGEPRNAMPAPSYGGPVGNALLAPLIDAYQNRDRPLSYRYAMAPIGEHDDGSYTLAWPQMALDMKDSAVRSLVGQEGAPVFDDGGQYVSGANIEPLDGFNVASIPAAGTLGAQAAGLTREAVPALADDTQAFMKAFSNPRGARFNGPHGYGLAKVAEGDPHDIYRITKDGTPVGQAVFNVRDGVANIGVLQVEGGPNSLGLTGMRDLREAFRGFYPEVTEFTSGQGQRVSGARRGPASAGTSDTQTVRLFANDSRASAPALMTNAMENAPLPMDQASRLARAQEMGFDTGQVWYHGTDAVFDAFDPSKFGSESRPWAKHGAFFSSSRKVADGYARDNAVGRSYDEWMKAQSEAEQWNANKRFWQRKRDVPAPSLAGSGQQVYDVLARPGRQAVVDAAANDLAANNALIDKYRTAGYDSVVLRNVTDVDGMTGEVNGVPTFADELVVFDPRNIRSTNAAFDPAQSHSANLLAANPSPSSLPYWMTGAGEDEQQDYLPPFRR